MRGKKPLVSKMTVESLDERFDDLRSLFVDCYNAQSNEIEALKDTVSLDQQQTLSKCNEIVEMQSKTIQTFVDSEKIHLAEIEKLRFENQSLSTQLANVLEEMSAQKLVLDKIQKTLAERKDQLANAYKDLSSSIQSFADGNDRLIKEACHEIHDIHRDSDIKLSQSIEENVQKLDSHFAEHQQNIEKMYEASANTNASIMSQLVGIEKNVKAQIAQEGKETAAHVDEKISVLSKKMDGLEDMKSQVSMIKRAVPSKIVYKNEFESQLIQPFGRFFADPAFPSKLNDLLKGLAPQDATTLLRIIARQQKVYETEKGKSLDLYTETEKQELARIREEFKQEIFHIGDDVFCYRNYKLPINHFETSVFWDKHGLGKLSPKSFAHIKNKNILDVGGYIGDSIQIFAPLTTKKVYTFEACERNFELLKKSIELNGLEEKVHAEHLALGAEEGRRKLFFSDSSTGFAPHPVSETLYEEETCVDTLDHYIRQHRISVGLIKVDIEGAEQEFLKGAKETISTQKPILLMSIYHNVSDFYNIKPILESWNLGYTFKIHKPIDHTISREILLIAEVADKE